MTIKLSNYARISGTGAYLPTRIVTNHDLANRVDTTNEWIVSRTGIEQRHIAGAQESTAMMATQAAQKALEAARIHPNDVDLIIVATCSPDNNFPSVACELQNCLGITNRSAAFDIAAACSGFIYALSVANQFIKAGLAKTALIVGSETLSRLVDWDDRATCVLFGDGAGAVVLQASNEPGVYSTHLHAAGEHTDLLSARHPTTTTPENCFIRMQGNTIFKLAVTELTQAVTETLAANAISIDKIDWFIPHQANLRIIQAIAKRLQLPDLKVVITLDKHANTSAASIPLALDTAVRDGRIKRGDVLLLEAFGSGLTWGSALVQY